MHRPWLAPALLLLLACWSDPAAPADSRPIVDAVTPDLAAQLSPDGLFQGLPRERPGEVTPAQAMDFALAYVKTFGAFDVEWWSEQHGAPIKLNALKPCGRPFYVPTAYQPLDAVIIRPIRSAFGSYWNVTLCIFNRPMVMVSVSAIATDLRVGGGWIWFPRFSGSEFQALGVPLGSSAGDEYRSPEAAALLAYSLTHRRVTSVPVMVGERLVLGSTTGRSWRIVLEQPVTLRGARTGAAYTTDTVYVGMVGDFDGELHGWWTDGDELMMPEAQQPDSEPFSYATEEEVLQDKPWSHGFVYRKLGIPFVYERVTVTE